MTTWIQDGEEDCDGRRSDRRCCVRFGWAGYGMQEHITATKRRFIRPDKTTAIRHQEQVPLQWDRVLDECIESPEPPEYLGL